MLARGWREREKTACKPNLHPPPTTTTPSPTEAGAAAVDAAATAGPADVIVVRVRGSVRTPVRFAYTSAVYPPHARSIKTRRVVYNAQEFGHRVRARWR